MNIHTFKTVVNMKAEAKEIGEKTALGVVGVGGSWVTQEFSVLLSTILTIIMIGWVLTQWAKFLWVWWFEWQAKKKDLRQQREQKARETVSDELGG